MAKKSKAKKKKKKSFVLSDEELDNVSGGTGLPVKRIGAISVTKGISAGGTVAEPFGGPRPSNRGTFGGFDGGQQM